MLGIVLMSRDILGDPVSPSLPCFSARPALRPHVWAPPRCLRGQQFASARQWRGNATVKVSQSVSPTTHTITAHIHSCYSPIFCAYFE